MSLFDQQTSLQGQGRFSPSVNYYAGIRKPNQPNPNLEKANVSFNIDLSRIGDAMIRQSDNQMKTEIEIAKIEASKNAKAQEEALKQLQMTTLNNYAKDVAHITDAVNQGVITSIAGQRQMRQLEDNYLSLNIVKASDLASVRGNYDGDVYGVQERDRKQWQEAENKEKISQVAEMHEAVPYTRLMSNDQVLALKYLADSKVDQLVAAEVRNKEIGGNYLSESTRSLADDVIDFQVDTQIANMIASGDPISSEINLLQNVNNGITSFANSSNITDPTYLYMMNKANAKAKDFYKNQADMTEEQKKYYQNVYTTMQTKTKLGIAYNYPEAFLANVMRTEGYYVEDEGATKVYYYGKDEFGTDRPIGVNLQNFMTVTNEPIQIPRADGGSDTAYHNFIIGKGGVYDLGTNKIDGMTAIKYLAAGGNFGGRLNTVAANAGTLTLATDSNVSPNPYTFSRLSEGDKQTAINNHNGVVNSLTSGAGAEKVKEAEKYSGTPYSEINNQYSVGKAMQYAKDNPEKFNKLIQFAQNNKGTLAGVNSDKIKMTSQGMPYYTEQVDYHPGVFNGSVEGLSRIFYGQQQKKALKELAPMLMDIQDLDTRKQMARWLFKGMEIPLADYDPKTDKQSITDPTLGETVGDYVRQGFEKGTEIVMEYPVKWVEQVYNKLEPYVQEWTQYGLKWAEDKGLKFYKDYEVYCLNNGLDPKSSAGVLKFLGDTVQQLGVIGNKGIDWTIDTYENIKASLADGKTIYDVGKAGGISDYVGERDFDFQAGPLDFKNPNNFPVFTDAEGNDVSVKTSTIGSDGRTYIVKTVDENGKDITPDDALARGWSLGSVAGEDNRAVAAAEHMANRMRQYIIENSNKPVTTVEQSTRPDARYGTSKRETGGMSMREISKPVEKKLVEQTEKALDKKQQNALGVIAKAVFESVTEGQKEAYVAGYNLDNESMDKLAKAYNKAGEKGFLYQTLWVASRMIPMLGGSMTRVGEESVANVTEWLLGALTIPGIRVEDVEQKARKLAKEYDKETQEIIEENLRRYNDRYDTATGLIFTQGLYSDLTPVNPLEPETRESKRNPDVNLFSDLKDLADYVF